MTLVVELGYNKHHDFSEVDENLAITFKEIHDKAIEKQKEAQAELERIRCNVLNHAIYIID